MYRKSRRTIALERKRARCSTMRAAKARKREELARTEPGWKTTGTYLIRTCAAPDGRTMAIYCHGKGTWTRCGSERAVRGALAKMLWR